MAYPLKPTKRSCDSSRVDARWVMVAAAGATAQPTKQSSPDYQNATTNTNEHHKPAAPSHHNKETHQTEIEAGVPAVPLVNVKPAMSSGTKPESRRKQARPAQSTVVASAPCIDANAAHSISQGKQNESEVSQC